MEDGLKDGATTAALTPKLVSLLGCGNDELQDVLGALGWRAMEVAGAAEKQSVYRRHAERHKRPQKTKALHPVRPDSPFAGLASLIAAK